MNQARKARIDSWYNQYADHLFNVQWITAKAEVLDYTSPMFSDISRSIIYQLDSATECMRAIVDELYSDLLEEALRKEQP